MAKKLHADWEEGEYEAVKERFPTITTWNDEDRTFISKAGNVANAKLLRNIRMWSREEQQAGNAARHDIAKNHYGRYLKFIEAGMRIGDACKRAGISYDAIKKMRALDPNFVQLEKEAEARAAEPIENSLYAAALNGNVPAAVKWLEKRSPERWPGDKVQIEQTHILELDASDHLTNIQTLIARLENRRQLMVDTGVIDAEVVDSD